MVGGTLLLLTLIMVFALFSHLNERQLLLLFPVLSSLLTFRWKKCIFSKGEWRRFYNFSSCHYQSKKPHSTACHKVFLQNILLCLYDYVQFVIKLLKMIRIPFCRVSGPTSLPNGVSNHRVQDDSTATVTKGLAEISTPSSEDGVEPGTSKPISEPVAAPASVSLVQNHIQDVTSAQISQPLVNNEPAELQSSTFSRQEPSLFFASRCSSQSDKGMSAFLYLSSFSSPPGSFKFILWSSS